MLAPHSVRTCASISQLRFCEPVLPLFVEHRTPPADGIVIEQNLFDLFPFYPVRQHAPTAFPLDLSTDPGTHSQAGSSAAKSRKRKWRACNGFKFLALNLVPIQTLAGCMQPTSRTKK